VINARLPFLLPWVRIALVIRTIRTTRWDDATWPTVKAALARALGMRRQINREGGWNMTGPGTASGQRLLLNSSTQMTPTGPRGSVRARRAMVPKQKRSKRAKKAARVKDLSARNASKAKGGATSKGTLWTDAVAGDLKSTVKF
jgi:hypothetical protein